MDRRKMMRSMSLSAQAKLFLFVFFTFAPLSVLIISRFAERRSGLALGAFMLMSGLTALGWVWAFMRSKKVLWILIPSQVLWFIIPYLMRTEFRSGFTFSIEGSACVALIVAGYLFFVSFIRGEGARTLRMETELDLARQIHAILVPPIEEMVQSVQIHGRSVPSHEMGGDLIDVVDSGDAVSVCIADVSGHGVKAGVVMAMTKTAVRLQLSSTSNVGGALAGVNHALCSLCSPEMFVTAICLRFVRDRSTNLIRHVEYVNAGHGPVLHYRASEKPKGSVVRWEGAGLPLGVMKNEEYQPVDMTVGPGDVLLLSTDGLAETFDANGRILGEAAIEHIFAAHACEPLPQLCDSVLEAVAAYGAQSDDRSLLLVRIT